MWSSSVYVWLLWRVISAPIVIPLRLMIRVIRGVFWPIPVLARFMWSVVRAVSFARVILSSLDPLYFFFFTGISIGIAVGIVLGVSSAAAQFLLQINGASLRRKEAKKTRESKGRRGLENGVEREAGREESREASRRKEIDYDGFREWYDEERVRRIAARNAENEARINKAEKEKEREEEEGEVYQRTRYEIKYDRGWMTPPGTILEEEEEEVYASGSENRRQKGRRGEEEAMERGRRRSYGKKRQGLQMR